MDTDRSIPKFSFFAWLPPPATIGDFVTDSLTEWLLILEHTGRLVSYETFAESDEKTWPDRQIDNNKVKYNENNNDNPR